jgi:hypothetical protein
MNAITLIGTERDRQLQDLGYTYEHDDDHIDGQIALAAACYAAGSSGTGIFVVKANRPHSIEIEDAWPWAMEDDKRTRDLDGEVTEPGYARDPKSKLEKRIRMLVKAGALICAEIDRLERTKHAS